MNVRQLRKKIRSVTNVKKITKAMELVSAVKAKKMQQIFFESKPYNDHIKNLLSKVIQKIDPKKSRLLQSSENEKHLIVLITTSKGLCGGFNYNLFRFVTRLKYASEADFITIGKKGMSFASGFGHNLIADFSEDPLSEVSALFRLVLKLFLDGTYGEIVFVYNKFASVFSYTPCAEVFLPVSAESLAVLEESTHDEYLIEPSAEIVLDYLLRSYLEEKIRFSILHSLAGEHSARMLAMKNATDNANDLIYNLTLVGNQLRQQKITYELLDITTARESVEKIW